MANALQESVFAAIDTLVGQRIDTLKLDKTVTATIVSCTNSLTGEYKVSYNGGTMTAYANEGTTYSKNTEVYVLVPQNDFTKTKYIVSKAQALANDNNISFVSSALSNYNLIGRNIIFDKKKNLPQGVCSYYPFDNCLIYDRDDLENSLVTINDEEFVNNLKEAEALMVEASFLTKLSREHRLTSTGNYGVKFTLAFKDASNSKVQLIESEDIVNNVQIDLLTSSGNIKDFNKAKEKIVELQKELEEIWANPNLSLEDKQKLTNDVNNKIASWVNINTTNGNFLSSDQQKEIQDLLDNQDYRDTSAGNITEDQEEYIKYYDYVIDSNNMTGNPFVFNTWADQYGIYPIEVENFLYIQRIVFYCENFVNEATNSAEGYSDNIFIKELEIYGLKTISAKSGDYSLSLSMPYGSTFKTLLADEYLEIVSKLNNKNTNISDSSMFYWFIEDNRITSTSEYYQYYGGAGWKYLKDKKNTPNLIVSGAENRAYENKYLCVGVYQDTVILKEYFTLYNDAARRQLEITSSLGVNFSFDQGTPKLTCLIDGKSEDFEIGLLNPKDDDHYRFIWSKTDEFGSSTVFNQTIEEVDQEIKDVTNDKNETRKGQILLELKARKQALQGVNFEVGKNWLEYPMRLVRANGSATFKCSVYKTDETVATDNSDFYLIGSAEIILQNSSVATPTDYYITIENGDQVFQYSESGVSPDDERYQDPLEIKPLTCHFFYPSGEEVEPAQYTVKWLVPISDTMIVTPKEGMISNPATGRIEWSTSQIYPTKIKGDYNYQALNNQVTCIVNFNNQEYTKETSFLFTKVGENGTNGTDLVGKISPIVIENVNILDQEMLTLRVKNMNPISQNDSNITDWNTGANINEDILQFSLYQRNEKLDGIDSVRWKMACGSNSYSKHMQMPDTIGHETAINWATDENTKDRKFESLIVRAQCTYRNAITQKGSPDTDTYYAFYGIPVINYASNADYYHIGIDTKQTLKTILYNADGRNPMYNKNQGVKINIDSDRYIRWKAEGGSDNNSPAFSLFKKEITEDGQEKMVPLSDNQRELNLTEIWIIPNDIYDGAYTNNLVHGFIYNSETGDNWETEIYIPIHMSLNTYGLASLNGWDGNHIEINEDDGFILAPQIGAGLKENKDNTFTGVVMGTVQTYDDKENPQVGLFGYAGGKQSIFLDARTGNAIFGLPESIDDKNKDYTAGRIELIPGGESKISSWTLGSRSLYNVKGGKLAKPDGTYRYAPTNEEGETPCILPHDKRGILLNANPSFISLKTDPIKLTQDQQNDLNRKIEEGDSLELELDPNQLSVFSIYRHVAEPIKDSQGNTSFNYLDRERIVGINSKGRFEVNALKDGDSSMGIHEVGAFGKKENEKKYIGADFEYNQNTFLKMFRPAEAESNGEIPLYISGSSLINEYVRPLSMHFKGINLYATDSTLDTETIKKTTNNKITLSGSPTGSLFAGRVNASYLNFSFDETGSSNLIVNNNLTIKTTTKDRFLNLISGNNSIKLSYGSSDEKGIRVQATKYASNITGDQTETITGNYSLQAQNGKIALSNNNFYLKTGTAEFKIKSDDKSELTLNNGLEVTNTSGKVSLTNYGADGITISSKSSKSNNSSNAEIRLITDNIKGDITLSANMYGSLSTATISSNFANLDIKGWTFQGAALGALKGLIVEGKPSTNNYSTGQGYWVNNPYYSNSQIDASIYCGGHIICNGQTFSQYNIITSNDIHARDIYAHTNKDGHGNLYGNNLYWVNGKASLTGDYYSSSRTNIWAHLKDIYAALNSLGGKVATAQQTADNAQNSANNKLTSSDLSNALKNYITKDKFNKHYHRVTAGTSHVDALINASFNLQKSITADNIISLNKVLTDKPVSKL